MNKSTYLLITFLCTFFCYAKDEEMKYPDVEDPLEVYDHTIRKYGNKHKNDISKNDLGSIDFKDDLETITLKAQSKQPVGSVVLSTQPYHFSGNNNNYEQNEILLQTPKEPKGTYLKYIFAASGLVDSKAHRTTHQLGYHLIKTNPSHIVPALIQWIVNSPEKNIYHITFSPAICKKCHYLLSIIYPKKKINTKIDNKACDFQPFTWPLSSTCMKYLNQKILQAKKPLETTYIILEKILGISEKRLTELQQENENIKKELQKSKDLLKQSKEQLEEQLQMIEIFKQSYIPPKMRLIREFYKSANNSNNTAAFAPFSNEFFTANSYQVSIYNTTNYNYRQALKAHIGSGLGSFFYSYKITSLTFSPMGTYVAYVSNNNILYIYYNRKPNYPLAKTIKLSQFKTINHLAYSPNEKQIACTSQNKIYIYNTNNYKIINAPMLEEGNLSNINSIAFSSNGEFLALARKKTLYVFDTISYKKISKLTVYDPILSIAFSSENKRIAIGSGSIIYMYDINTKKAKEVALHKNQVTNVIFDAAGYYLASSTQNGTLKIYSATTYQLLKTGRSYRGKVTKISFSYLSQDLASINLDGTVSIWRVVL